MGLMSWLTGGKPVMREPEEQAEVDNETRNLALYHFNGCPFCVKVHRAIQRLALDVPLRDVRQDPDARQELRAGGGSEQVPCLRIREQGGDERWMYESADIVAYLEERFG